MNHHTFTSLVLSGGAMKVLCSLGCILYLEKHDMINSIKNFVGTSAGGMLCFMLSIGYKAHEIASFFKENLNDPAVGSLDMTQVFDLISEYGLSDGDNLRELMSRALHARSRKKDITFIELAKLTGKNLILCVSNVSKEREEYLCVDTSPDMSVIEALRTTCSIPFLFRPIVINDDYYVDGALYNNFPMNYFKQDDNGLKDIIGINIIESDYQSTDNIVSFAIYMIMSILNKSYERNQDVYCNHDRNIVTLRIKTPDWLSLSALQIKFPDDETLRKMLEIGYQSMATKLA